MSINVIQSEYDWSIGKLILYKYVVPKPSNNNINIDTEYGATAEEPINIVEKRPAVSHQDTHINNNNDPPPKRQKQKHVSPKCRNMEKQAVPAPEGDCVEKSNNQRSSEGP
ncbi:hypothetical protein BDC45DRAFT_574689 [Circinella umbellata]|nr:hypothetical protein BDC45DRAFT_574689 [Circinella umbellata]